MAIERVHVPASEWKREVISKPGAAIHVTRITPPKVLADAMSAALEMGRRHRKSLEKLGE